MKPDAVPDPEAINDPDALAALIDELMASGTQHLNLESGSKTRIRTVNSTECSGTLGPCAVPNFDYNDEDEAPESEDDLDDDEL